MAAPKGHKTYRRNDISEPTAEKIAEAMRLQRDFGYSKEKVAEVMGISNVYAGKLIKRGIQEIFRAETQDAVAIHLARLAEQRKAVLAVLAANHLLVNAGEVVTDYIRDPQTQQPLEIEGVLVRVPLRDQGPILAAVDRLLKIDESERKLLGLDKPTKIAPTNPNGDEPVPMVQVYLPDNGRS